MTRPSARTRALRHRSPIASFACVVLATCAAMLGTEQEASASGYDVARFGADYGTPAMSNTFSVYFNPAALGGTKGTTITGDIAVLGRWASYTRPYEALSPQTSDINDPNYQAANTGRANLFDVMALPYVGVNTDFGGSEYIRAGFATYLPFGGAANWDRRDYVAGTPGTRDGVQRWHNISGTIISLFNTAAIAVVIPKTHLSFGASVSGVINKVSTVRARNVDGSDDTFNKQGALVEGRSYLDASGFDIAAGFGVYYEPTEDLHFGLSYMSQPGFGEQKLSGTLRAQSGATTETNPESVNFYQSFPDVVRFGAVAQLTPKWLLRSDFSFTRWSVFNRQCVTKKGQDCAVADDGRDLSNGNVILNIPRNWNNSVSVRVGPGYKLNDMVDLFGSASIATPAVPKSTIDASTIDAFAVYATAGAHINITKNLAIAGSYNHVFFTTVNTNGQNNQSLKDHPGGDYNVSRSPSADGKYKQQVGYIDANIAYTF